jgi:hypothetical protein
MPQRNSAGRLLIRLVLFTLAGWLLWALGREDSEPEVAKTKGAETTRTHAQGGFSKRRLATTLAFTTLFFAGAAFSAGAGDLVVGALEGSDTCTTEATAEDAAADPAACDAASDQASSTEADGSGDQDSADEATDPAPEPAPSGDEQSGDEAGNGSDDGASTGDDQSAGDDGSTTDGGSTTDDGSTGDQGVENGQPGGGSAGSDQSGPDPILDGDGSGDGSGADQDDEPDAGPGSPAHAGDDQGGEDDPSVGPVSEDDAAPDLEFDNDTGYGVVWLHRTLPDPTPPAARLNPRFAGLLSRTAKANHVDWALVLGVIRADGHKSSWPARGSQLRSLSSRLHDLRANADPWRAALALAGRTSFADRAVALSHYNRAVGLRGLVRGLVAESPALEQRVLSDSRLSIYPGGRDDVVQHRINVRILVLVEYLAETYGSVTVSSLDSGHRLYARPGVVSAHKYGLAVDIAALGGTPIVGHQQVGSITEKAVRSILLLPVELRPKQVISLLGLGGPSFPLADHYDHIHVGY